MMFDCFECFECIKHISTFGVFHLQWVYQEHNTIVNRGKKCIAVIAFENPSSHPPLLL